MIGDAWPGGKDVVKLGVPSLDNEPKIEAEEEVRLAVVLYGGSSLCIYMNGVAQELLRLVRATAGQTFDPETTVAFPTQDLDGTEQVYRRLAQLGPNDRGTPKAGDPLRRRFVIDILTGSSAGGINGIFLAKALANDQSLDQLKQLWIEKGDIVQLYNDGKHSKDVHLKPERPPKSLLDGRWMYANLVTALDGMGSDPEVTSPLVRELDLFVTATDLYGLPTSYSPTCRTTRRQVTRPRTRHGPPSTPTTERRSIRDRAVPARRQWRCRTSSAVRSAMAAPSTTAHSRSPPRRSPTGTGSFPSAASCSTWSRTPSQKRPGTSLRNFPMPVRIS
jgi:patatin-related protein